jgi:hypothetical protein
MLAGAKASALVNVMIGAILEMVMAEPDRAAE